MEDIQHY